MTKSAVEIISLRRTLAERDTEIDRLTHALSSANQTIRDFAEEIRKGELEVERLRTTIEVLGDCRCTLNVGSVVAE